MPPGGVATGPCRPVSPSPTGHGPGAEWPTGRLAHVVAASRPVNFAVEVALVVTRLPRPASGSSGVDPGVRAEDEPSKATGKPDRDERPSALQRRANPSQAPYQRQDPSHGFFSSVRSSSCDRSRCDDRGEPAAWPQGNAWFGSRSGRRAPHGRHRTSTAALVAARLSSAPTAVKWPPVRGRSTRLCGGRLMRRGPQEAARSSTTWPVAVAEGGADAAAGESDGSLAKHCASSLGGRAS
jgi:hypothetical protein